MTAEFSRTKNQWLWDETRCIHILKVERFLFRIEDNKPLEQIAKCWASSLSVFPKQGWVLFWQIPLKHKLQLSYQAQHGSNERWGRASCRHKVRADDPVGPSGHVLCEHTKSRSFKLFEKIANIFPQEQQVQHVSSLDKIRAATIKIRDSIIHDLPLCCSKGAVILTSTGWEPAVNITRTRKTDDILKEPHHSPTEHFMRQRIYLYLFIYKDKNLQALKG